jgi:excinuclease ABC subunit C
VQVDNHIKEQVSAIPHKPGVYQYYDKNNQLLYVGKAKNLKKRVSSYFVEKNNNSSRITILIKKIWRIEYTIVSHEKDALLLENTLIKELKPKYNIQLRDDKSYPFIAILNEPFPRVIITRNPEKNGSQYFGPYTSVRHIRSILNLIKKLYPIRNCTLALTEKNIKAKKFKVCLEYHIKNCYGPCEGKQTEEEYKSNIEEIKKILKGNYSEVKLQLQKHMEMYALNLQFEKAAIIKEKIIALSEYAEKSIVVNPSIENTHVFSLIEDNIKVYVNHLYVSKGNIIKSEAYIISRKLEEPLDEILKYILDRHIDEIGTETVIAPILPTDNEYPFEVSVPKIGDKKKLLDLATINALHQKEKHTLKHQKTENYKEKTLLELKNTLNLKYLPLHIECFDNSNLQGTNPTASVVVFKNGIPSKKDYRHFNIKTVVGANDFASMEEVVYRRYWSLLDKEQQLPNLIVIDGGKGQLNAAMQSIKKLGMENKIDVVSLAKRLEEVFKPGEAESYIISRKSDAIKTLQFIRNEAHRFAIAFHRNKRSNNSIQNELEDIPGIGKQTIKKLLTKYKSVKKISSLTLEELNKEIDKSKSNRIKEYFNNKKGEL